LILLLFFLSGATGLVYQVVWTRLLILVFGSTVLGISTIVTAFLGGLALGSFLFGRKADLLPRPLRLYGWFEILIGLYALAVPFLFDGAVPLFRWFWEVSGFHYEALSVFRFVMASLLLVLPTTLMGATLPLLVSFASRGKGRTGEKAGLLYGLNTLGAVLGTLGSGFFLLPAVGVQKTIFLCAVANVVVGLFALKLDRSLRREKTPVPSQVIPESRMDRLILGVSFCSGLAALVLEVCWSRLFGTIYGSSLHGFCVTLSAFLMGIGLGSLLGSVWLRRRNPSLLSYGAIELAMAAGALLSLYVVREIIYWNFALFNRVQDLPIGWLLMRYGFVTLAILVPTTMMGMSFPMAVALLGDRGRPGSTAGKLYGWNTLGSILGSFSAGFLLLPVLGLEGTLLGAILLLAVLGMVLVAASKIVSSGWSLKPAVLCGGILGLGLVLFFLRPPWNPGTISLGGVYFISAKVSPGSRSEFFADVEGANPAKTKIFYEDGRNASVGVYRGRTGKLFLEVNGKVDASTTLLDMRTQVLTAVLPMLMDFDPKKALVIGCGSGTTVGVLARFAELEEIELVELESAVVRASRHFEDVNHNPFEDPRVRWIENDGRNSLLLNPTRYDLIVSEPSNPWMMGAANLFTKDFFSLVRSRLTDDGIFSQWIQLYAIQPEHLKMLLRTILSEFPEAIVFAPNEGDLIVVSAKQKGLQLDVEKLMRVFKDSKIQEDLFAIELNEPFQLLAGYRLNPAKVKEFAGEGIFNTDDNLKIESETPYSLFAPTGKKNLEALRDFPSAIVPFLRLPEGERAIDFVLDAALGFLWENKRNFSRQFYKEFLRLTGVAEMGLDERRDFFQKSRYKRAETLSQEFGYQ